MHYLLALSTTPTRRPEWRSTRPRQMVEIQRRRHLDIGSFVLRIIREWQQEKPPLEVDQCGL
jgi:hypothetical protein